MLEIYIKFYISYILTYCILQHIPCTDAILVYFFSPCAKNGEAYSKEKKGSVTLDLSKVFLHGEEWGNKYCRVGSFNWRW